ncbi:CDGSH iron-sulfur domain-containing protein [Streptomyces sp. NPDC059916]|uniref:CDGSH iron-sulfur domain-containing protein n=1 Tax=Streptomyces sp. NPDC059916 TaxID=3347001 RepID=UPI00369941A8
MASARPSRLTTGRGQRPFLREGPAGVVDETGAMHVSRRLWAAVCTCRRSRTFPWCNTSHRARRRTAAEPPATLRTSSAPNTDCEDDRPWSP